MYNKQSKDIIYLLKKGFYYVIPRRTFDLLKQWGENQSITLENGHLRAFIYFNKK